METPNAAASSTLKLFKNIISSKVIIDQELSGSEQELSGSEQQELSGSEQELSGSEQQELSGSEQS
jgi:hypothetical protein